ncbi:hypothetical protein GCM10027589_14430 [Actinocorallia lasiicapitis]
MYELSEFRPVGDGELAGLRRAGFAVAAVAVAESGTIILAGGPGEWRQSLAPRSCVVPASVIIATPADAVARLPPSSPQRWVTGGSAFELVLLAP